MSEIALVVRIESVEQITQRVVPIAVREHVVLGEADRFADRALLHEPHAELAALVVALAPPVERRRPERDRLGTPGERLGFREAGGRNGLARATTADRGEPNDRHEQEQGNAAHIAGYRRGGRSD